MLSSSTFETYLSLSRDTIIFDLLPSARSYFNGVHVLKNDQVISILNFGQLTACLAPQQQIQQPKYNVNGKSYNVVNQNQLTSSEHCFRSVSNQQSPYQMNQRNMTANAGVVRQQYSSSSLERTQSSSHTMNTLLSYSNHQRKEMVSTLHSNKPTGQHSPVQPFVKKPLILHPQGAPSETSPPKSIGITSPNTSTTQTDKNQVSSTINVQKNKMIIEDDKENEGLDFDTYVHGSPNETFNCTTCSLNGKKGAQRCATCCHFKKAHVGRNNTHVCVNPGSHNLKTCPTNWRHHHKGEQVEEKKKKRGNLIMDTTIGNELKNAKSPAERDFIVKKRLGIYHPEKKIKFDDEAVENDVPMKNPQIVIEDEPLCIEQQIQDAYQKLEALFKLKEERDEKIAQSRILELLKEEEATKDLLAFFEDRKKQGLSLLPSLGEEDFSENTIDVEDVD